MKTWAVDVAIRAVKTMAQAAIGVIGSSAVISEINWGVVVSTAVVAGLVSVLMSLSNIPIEKGVE